MKGYSHYFIDVEIECVKWGDWRATFYYGQPNRNRREESWDLIHYLASQSRLPWIYVGHYNDILCDEEKRGEAPQPEHLMVGFQEAIEDGGLVDLIMSGFQFTWEQSRGTNDWI